jgi:hypothetical protein
MRIDKREESRFLPHLDYAGIPQFKLFQADDSLETSKADPPLNGESVDLLVHKSNTMKRLLKDYSSLILILAALYSATAGLLYLALTKSYQPINAYGPLRMAMFCLMLPVVIKYVIQLLGAPIYSIVEAVRQRRNMTNTTPSVSVCIPRGMKKSAS